MSGCYKVTDPGIVALSNLKNLYLSSYQLQCRMVAHILTQDQYLTQKYPNPN